jgi:hypothetical protein
MMTNSSTFISDISKEEILSFFNQFSQLDDNDQISIAEAYLPLFDQLKQNIMWIEEKNFERTRRTANDYNIFKILGIERDEARFHSAMLANLLNPIQSHKQNLLFLKSFLELCITHDLQFPVPTEAMETGYWEVKCEYDVHPHGRIDILIRNSTLRYLVVIENKVDALEQENQLARYSEWLYKQKINYPIQALVFLTPEGRRPYTASDSPVFCLSYNEDIYHWLEKVIPLVPASNVCEVIRQYSKLVQSL